MTTLLVADGFTVRAVKLVADTPGLRASPASAVGRMRLPTEPLGTMTLTLINVVVGSRYRIERQGDGSLATPTASGEGVAASGTVAVTLDYYAAGNANNDVRIKVRKASAVTRYKPFETQATLTAAAQSVFVGQISDE